MPQTLRRIAEVSIRGAVVSWSTPETFLGGRPGSANRQHVHIKNRRLIAWQDTIRAAIDRQIGGPRTPHQGPVMLSLTFTKGTPDRRLWGKRWWTAKAQRGSGDLTNFAKAAEDAIKTWDQYRGKGVDRVLVLRWPGLIGDDSQVCDSFQRKRYGPQDGAEIRVYAFDEGPGGPPQESPPCTAPTPASIASGRTPSDP